MTSRNIAVYRYHGICETYIIVGNFLIPRISRMTLYFHIIKGIDPNQKRMFLPVRQVPAPVGRQTFGRGRSLTFPTAFCLCMLIMVVAWFSSDDNDDNAICYVLPVLRMTFFT